MAASVLNNGNHLQKSNDRYRFIFRRCKTACRSKPAPGITVKKFVSPAEGLNCSSPESNEVIKKRKHEEVIPTTESSESVRPSVDDIYKKRKRREVFSGYGSVDRYEELDSISQGSYGDVCRAVDKETGEIVAMKEEYNGLSKTTEREIDILKSLGPHPCIVGFKQVVVDDYDGVFIVMEYVENDLKRYMDARVTPLAVSEAKPLMRQLLEGVEFLHRNRVMHRDLKPSNVLINNGRQLKICDFGLSRSFGVESGSYTTEVVTIWYRAPELLLGAESYSFAIDMWSAGCIMAELVLKEVIFPGGSEIDMLGEIYKVLGTPGEADWPGFLNLPGSNVKVVQQPNNLLRKKLCATGLTEAGLDLLERLLMYDPAKRITAECALDHAWFKEIE